MTLKQIIHKRLSAKDDSTLCGEQGAKIFLSSQVTCSKCLDLISKKSNIKS